MPAGSMELFSVETVPAGSMELFSAETVLAGSMHAEALAGLLQKQQAIFTSNTAAFNETGAVASCQVV